MLTNLLLTLIKINIMASIVAAITLIFKVILKKFGASRKLLFCLWLVIGLRFVCPDFVNSKFSFFNLYQLNFNYSNEQEIQNNELVEFEKINNNLEIPEISTNVANNNEIQPVIIPNNDTVSTEILKNDFDKNIKNGNNLKTTDFIMIAWIFASILMILYAVVSYIKLKRNVMFAKGKGDYYETDMILSPCVIGIIKPKIYLMPNISDEDRKYILIHESVHIKRKDYISKMIAYLILSIHVFNPLCWVLFKLFVDDMEMLCDEESIKKMEKENKAGYMESLVNLSTKNMREILPCPIAFSKNNTEKRVKNMIKYKRSGIIISIVALISCVVIAVMFLTNGDSNIDVKSDDVVNKEAEKQFEKETLQAYGDALKDFHDNFRFPDGTVEELYDPNYNVSDNRFAIADIDMDGENELILSLTHPPMAAMRAIIYEYDYKAKTLKEKFTEFTDMAFYDNGVIATYWSHNQGSAGDALWPYTMYKYDRKREVYEVIAQVDAWDKSFSSRCYLSEEFPQEIDKDGDGIVYYIMPNGSYDNMYAVDLNEYNSWRSQYINESAKKIEVKYMPLTKENIDVAIKNYEYIKVPDDSKINEIIVEGEMEEVLYVGVNSNIGYTIQYDKEDLELYRQDGKDYYRSRLDAIKDKVYFTVEHLKEDYDTKKNENKDSKESIINGRKTFCLTYIDNILISENDVMNLPNITFDSDVKKLYYIDATDGVFLIEVHYFYEASEGWGVRIAQMINTFKIDVKEFSFQSRVSDYLEKEFHRVYDPYYDIQSLTISNWKENNNEATFFYNMKYLNYNRNPDTVEYIQEAKKTNKENYQTLYNDYLAVKDVNYEFKVILKDNGELELYSNVAGKGTKWELTKIDDYILY